MIELKPHQIKASNEILDVLNKYNVAILSGEPRTMKTLTVIDVCNRIFGSELQHSLLLVTTLNAKESVSSDIASNLNKNIICELINFESLHKSKSKSYDMLIIDEVHNIGYIQKPKLITKKLAKIKYKYYIGMSGTLFLETFSTAFSLYRFAFKGYEDFYHWAHDFVDVKIKYIGDKPTKDYKTIRYKDKLMAIINPYTIKITQEDAGFKTKVNDIIHDVNSKAINKLCSIIRRDKKYSFKCGKTFVADNISREFQAIKQLQSGGFKIAKDDYLLLDKFKVDYVINNFKDKKIAIYYNYVSEKMMLELHLAMDGYITTDDQDLFNSTDHKTVYIGQFRSKREGVKLSSSNDIIFLSMPYSNLSFLQSRERCILRDKTEPINCHILCTKFDRKVYDVVKIDKGVFSYEIYKKIKGNSIFEE